MGVRNHAKPAKRQKTGESLLQPSEISMRKISEGAFSPAAYANERAAKAKVSICALSRGGAVLALVADSGVAVAGLQRGKRVVWRA